MHCQQNIKTSLMDPCNANQVNAVFIPSLFRHSTSTCFGHICSPSSGEVKQVKVHPCTGTEALYRPYGP